MTIELNMIIYPEMNSKTGSIAWIAQCVEYDILSQGKTIEEAKKRLDRNILATMRLAMPPAANTSRCGIGNG